LENEKQSSENINNRQTNNFYRRTVIEKEVETFSDINFEIDDIILGAETNKQTVFKEFRIVDTYGDS
jgi:hypothetical protein